MTASDEAWTGALGMLALPETHATLRTSFRSLWSEFNSHSLVHFSCFNTMSKIFESPGVDEYDDQPALRLGLTLLLISTRLVRSSSQRNRFTYSGPNRATTLAASAEGDDVDSSHNLSGRESQRRRVSRVRFTPAMEADLAEVVTSGLESGGMFASVAWRLLVERFRERCGPSISSAMLRYRYYSVR